MKNRKKKTTKKGKGKGERLQKDVSHTFLAHIILTSTSETSGMEQIHPLQVISSCLSLSYMLKKKICPESHLLSLNFPETTFSIRSHVNNLFSSACCSLFLLSLQSFTLYKNKKAFSDSTYIMLYLIYLVINRRQ